MGNCEYPLTPTSISTTVETSTQSDIQDVAIVGMSCHTAGGNDTPEKLWKFLMDKKHASGDVPKRRWEPWLRRDPRNAKTIESTTPKGYFIEDLEYFDAAFFGISPKEAELMDPHQRLALELAWEALENAGIDPTKLAGSDTSVFMGVDSDDYSRLILEDLPNIEAWSGIGTAYHGIPNRISYHLDFMGPSTAVDSACASSLIAMHLGRQAILAGESTVALCGEVNVLCAPGLTHMLEKAGALSPDCVYISFDDDARGYARGEGGGIIVLKDLATAMADNDNILAVLKGTATAQDGKTNDIMAPNGKAQEMVARQALSRAGDMDPLTIGYVEAHATSTSLGDPTEVSAISKVYGIGRSKNTPCAVGSIKPNVGHLEAAAGAIGFVKAVLTVNKGELAPQALLKRLNSRIDWEKSGLEFVQELSQWPEALSPRRAAVCSYGYGGSVAHAIIERAPSVYRNAQGLVGANVGNGADSAILLVLSSLQERRLADHAQLLANWLATAGKNQSLKAVASTLAQRRAAHDYRLSLVVANHEEAIDTLGKYADGSLPQWVASSRVLGNTVSKGVVWVFSGHGAQWTAMGKELLKDNVFYDAVIALDPIIEQEAGFSAISALKAGAIDGSDGVQVLTYLVQVGLVEVLHSKGVKPQAIIGHSVGEIAASVVAGCLTPKEGALVVSRRAKLFVLVKGYGGMALINLPFTQAFNEVAGKRDIVAAINSSPSSCVVSGELSALKQYLSSLHQRGIKTFGIRTDIAFHSPMLNRLIEPLIVALSGALDPRPATLPIYSTSHQDPRTDTVRGVEYWIHNMINPVRLREATDAAIDDGFRIFLEVSTHPIVSHSIHETLAARRLDESATISIMKRDTSSERSILHAIAQLHNLGASVDFKAHFGISQWSTAVPNTPWVKKPYWKEVETGNFGAVQQHDVDEHILLGHSIDVARSEMRIFTTTLHDKSKPYPLTHPLDGTEIVPAAVYCNTFYRATGATVLEGVELRVPLPITSEQRDVQVVVQSDCVRLSARLKTVDACSHGLQHAWTEHSSCHWRQADTTAFSKMYSIECIKKRIGTLLPNKFAWGFLQKIGVSAIAFPWAVMEHYGNEREMIVKMDMDTGFEIMEWDFRSWAPFLDAATSIGSTIFFKDPRMRIVSGVEKVLFVSRQPPPKIGYLYVEEASDGNGFAANVSVLNEQGMLLAKLQSMRFSDIEVAADRTTGVDALVHQLAWVPSTFVEKPMELKHVLLVSDDLELSKAYTGQLESTTSNVLQVTSAVDFTRPNVSRLLSQKGAAVMYIPGRVHKFDDIPAKAHAITWEAAMIVKALHTFDTPPKVFIVTDNIHRGTSYSEIAQAPLLGFARIAAQEHPEVWGGLIDNEGTALPLLALKHVRDKDVIWMQDGFPRVARMRPFMKEQRHKAGSIMTLLPKAQGTYVVTGGFGALGLEVLDFLVSKGARRIVAVSRRSLPSRGEWRNVSGQMKVIVDKIETLEARGATICGIALDIGASNAHARLLAAIDCLSFPPILGVIHAAGINEDGLIKTTTPESFARVFNPKVAGALTLHRAFPPATLDSFILFSSIGQLVGTPGQAPYGAANAFLHVLATHRRRQGDNAIAIQWTAWRGMGLAADSEFLTMELKSKGITDITCQEAFHAWEHLSRYDTDHAIVTRTRILDPDEPIPFPLVSEIAPRRPHRISLPASASASNATESSKRPTSADLRPWVNTKVCECIGSVLHLDIEEIDIRASIADLGVDSVMTIGLRQELQRVLGVKVPPTLTWKVDTVGGLVEWFYENIVAEERV